MPHRLLTFQLIRGVEVCVICGPTPSVTDLQNEVRSGTFSLATPEGGGGKGGGEGGARS